MVENYIADTKSRGAEPRKLAISYPDPGLIGQQNRRSVVTLRYSTQPCHQAVTRRMIKLAWQCTRLSRNLDSFRNLSSFPHQAHSLQTFGIPRELVS